MRFNQQDFSGRPLDADDRSTPRPRPRTLAPPPARTTTMAISAYVTRWGHVASDETGTMVRELRDSLDAWLQGPPAAIPMHVSHEDGTEIGWFSRFEADDIGILAHGEVDLSRPLGASIAAKIRSGAITQTSCVMRFADRDATPARVTRDGKPVSDIRDLIMTEAGPTPTPSDAGALIVAVDGEVVRTAQIHPGSFAAALPYVEAVMEASGIPVATAQDVEYARRDREYDKQRKTAETARWITWVAKRLTTAQRAADAAWRDAHSRWPQPGDHRRCADLDAEAQELDATLRELICNDRDIFDQLRAKYGFRERPMTPMGRTRSLAKMVRR